MRRNGTKLAVLAWFFLMLGSGSNKVATVVGPFQSQQACQAYQAYLDQAGAEQFQLILFKCWSDHRE